MTVARSGEVTFPPPKISVSAAPAAKKAEAPKKIEQHHVSKGFKIGCVIIALLCFLLIGLYAPAKFLPHFTVFVLAVVVGYYVVWNVTHALHTPLMSVTNAISGIIIVGAMEQLVSGSVIVGILAFIGTMIASINIFGGFAVTRRMLGMFRKQGK